ncbi:MAG: thioredoxin family protein [Chloroflexota bacterium]|nr:thioredoxin family protein [Chloroflexota bacterium]
MKKLILIFLFSILVNCSTASQENLISLFVITEDLELGENRVVLTILDENGNTLTNDLKFYYKKIEAKTKQEIKNKTISNWPPNRKVFITKIDFDEIGYWEIIVEAGSKKAKATINIKENSKTLSIGESIEPIFTPSLSDYNLSEITTDINPNTNLYQYSLDKALLEQKPIFITFSTPGLCVTGTCSPQLEELKKISNNYNEVIIIHVEIWKNFKEVMQKGDLSLGILNESVKTFGIETEPWTFLISKGGIVKNRYQGFVEYKELEKDLQFIIENQ